MQTVWDPVSAYEDCYIDYQNALTGLEEMFNAGEITAEERDEGIGEANRELDLCREYVDDAQDHPRPVDPTDE